MCRPSRASSPSTRSSSRRTPWLATREGRRGSWRRASTTNFFDSPMRELTGGEAEAQAGAGGGEGPGQAAAAQVGVEVEAGGAEVGAKGGGGGREAGALTLQQLRSRKSSKRTGPIGDGQKSTTFLCQRWALLPEGRVPKTWVAGWHCHPEGFCASGKFLRVTLKIALRSFRTLWKISR